MLIHVSQNVQGFAVLFSITSFGHPTLDFDQKTSLLLNEQLAMFTLSKHLISLLLGKGQRFIYSMFIFLFYLQTCYIVFLIMIMSLRLLHNWTNGFITVFYLAIYIGKYIPIQSEYIMKDTPDIAAPGMLNDHANIKTNISRSLIHTVLVKEQFHLCLIAPFDSVQLNEMVNLLDLTTS